MRYRLVWLLLLTVCVVGLASGTSGFSTASVDRDVSIVVSESHQRAFVAIWDPGTGGTGGEPPEYAGESPVASNQTPTKVLVVKNQFRDHTIDVTVTNRAGSPVTVDGGVSDLAPNGVAPVVATVDCNGHAGRTTATLDIAVTTTDGAVEAVIPYDATVVCGDPPRSTGPKSNQTAA